jgi:hypothetical protein
VVTLARAACSSIRYRSAVAHSGSARARRRTGVKRATCRLGQECADRTGRQRLPLPLHLASLPGPAPAEQPGSPARARIHSLPRSGSQVSTSSRESGPSAQSGCRLGRSHDHVAGVTQGIRLPGESAERGVTRWPPDRLHHSPEWMFKVASSPRAGIWFCLLRRLGACRQEAAGCGPPLCTGLGVQAHPARDDRSPSCAAACCRRLAGFVSKGLTSGRSAAVCKPARRTSARTGQARRWLDKQSVL